MTLTSIVSISLSLTLFLIGLLTFLRNSKSNQNRNFFIVCILSAIWGFTFQSIESFENISYVRASNSAAYILGLLLILSVLYFTQVFPIKRSNKYFKWYVFVVVPTLLLSLTNLVAGTVSVDAQTGNYVFEYGLLTPLYNLVMGIGIILIAKNILRGRKKFTAEQYAQARMTGFGFVLSFIFGVGLSTVLPLFDSQTSLDDLAPFSLVFLAGFTSLAIVKHKLFDFRAALIRALTYLITTVVIIIIYVTIGLLLNSVLNQEVSETQKFIQNIAITVVLVIIYPYVKNWFDNITGRIFFRDAYDPQTFLGELNRALVTDTEIESLLTKSALVIQENLKTSFCTFFLRETSYFPNRFIGAHRDPEIKELVLLNSLSQKIHKKVHTTELEPSNENEKDLNRVLRLNGIEVIARLVNTLDYEIAGIGSIFIGPKKNGSLYTVQDLKIIEIIANELVIAIENVLRFEEIEQFNVTLQKKIDDATKELKESNDKLRALDEAKDEFVSMASHQLRTPLTSIKGYLSMVLEGDAGKITDTQAKMLGQAFFSSQRMVYLISDLLNVSRLKTGKFIIESKPVFLPAVVDSEIQQLVEGANSKDLTLLFSKPKEFPTMNLDEMKLRQVIMNFTDNAIYYTPNGGKITVTLKETPKSIEFTVKDSGIGVPKEQQHKLFQKFYRADNARKIRPDGTGLGLFMAKKVIIAQGGSLIFDSTEGKGSTFGFSFPREKLEIKPPTPDKES